MMKRELILVCGISGAGKSVTMDYFDSAGFYCIDNLPVKALESTVKALQYEEGFVRYAIAINSNANEEVISFNLNRVQALEWVDIKILYLDVSDEELYKRFQMTRKHHPFSNQNESLNDAIKQERELLRGLRQYATMVVDTTDLSPEKLKATLSNIFADAIIPKFRVSFVSFGYKYGLPQNIDYAFDVRFIDNPYYYSELRDLTGNDKPVYEFVMEQETTEDFLRVLHPLLDLCIKKHKDTNRSYLVIGIGCTGGQHRSVTLCNYLTDHYKEKYYVVKEHRDVK